MVQANKLIALVLAAVSRVGDLHWPHTESQGLTKALAKEKSKQVKGRGIAD